MTCSSEERLAKLTSSTRREKMRPERTLNMLKAVPDIVVFQNYNLGDVQMIPISILNTYEVVNVNTVQKLNVYITYSLRRLPSPYALYLNPRQYFQ